MLQPKKTTFRKFQKRHPEGVRVQALAFGRYGLQALACGHLSAACLEAARRAMTRKLKRSGQIWIRVFPDLGVSRKPAEVRMGKGKGAVHHWACPVQRGQILFELAGVSAAAALGAVALAQGKLPLPTQFVALEPKKA